MDKKYWEDVAPQHKDKIFDVFVNDRKGIIQNAIKKYAHRGQTSLDLGCAIGKWLPVLSSVSSVVYAVDIAKRYLDVAEDTHRHLSNIRYLHIDLSKPGKKIPPADMVLCVNTLLTDDEKRRDAIFHSVVSRVKRGGHLVLVVPALESALFSKIMLREWDRIDKVPVEKFDARSKGNAYYGIIELDGTPTKHYLKEELMFLLQKAGFEVKEAAKVEYTWHTEFKNPPKWMQSPVPWDWMVVGIR